MRPYESFCYSPAELLHSVRLINGWKWRRRFGRHTDREWPLSLRLLGRLPPALLTAPSQGTPMTRQSHFIGMPVFGRDPADRVRVRYDEAAPKRPFREW
jgi:hypothetical protein